MVRSDGVVVAELLVGPVSEVVVAQRRVERARAGQLHHLHRRDAPAAGRFLPPLVGVDDLAGKGDGLHPGEVQPLHVPHHGDPGHVA